MTGIDRLSGVVNTAISRYKRLAQQKGVRRGRINGSTVEIGGKVYPFDPAVGVRFKTGDTVYVMIADGVAVIVGR